MVKVVCFDVGGVLIRITRNWCEAAKLAGVFIRSDIPPEARLWDVPFFLAYEGGNIDDAQYIRELAVYLGEVSEEEATRVHNHIMVEPLPRVEEIVAQLNGQGYITACLSNTNEPHWTDMFESGRFSVMDLIQVRVASHRVGVPKPDPRVFDAFEREVGASGAEIVFFDDSAVNVEAALTRGWQAFLVDHTVTTYQQIAEGLRSVGIEIGLPDFSENA